MTASMTLIPSPSAHKPAWQIPTYAYIETAPHIVGIRQTDIVYMWLDSVYGAAGGTTEAVIGNAYTCSAALPSKRLQIQKTTSLPLPRLTERSLQRVGIVCTDPTSSLYTDFTPTAVGVYNLTFSFPGQVYGAKGDGYAGSVLVNDTYVASTATTTLTVQSTPIAPAITGEPLPTDYWNTPNIR